MEEPTTRDNPVIEWNDVDLDGDDYYVEVAVLSQGGMMLTINSCAEFTTVLLSDEQAKRLASALTPPADSDNATGEGNG